MQRRDARSFFEEVLSRVPEISGEMREKLLALANDKAGGKRAAKIAAVLAADDAAGAEDADG